MSNSTISLLELFRRFPDQDSARLFMEQQRWSNGVICPHCQECDRIGTHKGGYRCNVCMEVLTVRTKTVMERSHIPLHRWIYGMYLLVTTRKGVSSLQLSKELGITQSSAWFMLQRLREACNNTGGPLSGIVAIDETYIGGKEKNKQAKKKLNAGRGLSVSKRLLAQSNAAALSKPRLSATRTVQLSTLMSIKAALDMERIEALFGGAIGKRPTYSDLTA